MCDCIALIDMRITGLDCFDSFKCQKSSDHLNEAPDLIRKKGTFVAKTLWLIVLVHKKNFFEAFSRQKRTVQGVSTGTNSLC